MPIILYLLFHVNIKSITKGQVTLINILIYKQKLCHEETINPNVEIVFIAEDHRQIVVTNAGWSSIALRNIMHVTDKGKYMHK
jgi:hypothetical protein